MLISADRSPTNFTLTANMSKKIIMGGDFNVPLNLQLDSYGSKSEKIDVVIKIRDLMLDFNLVDIWRLRNPDKKCYKWK